MLLAGQDHRPFLAERVQSDEGTASKIKLENEGWFKKTPFRVFIPVQCTEAYVKKTTKVQGPHFCSLLVYNPVLGNTQSVNIVMLTVRRDNCIYKRNSDNCNKI